ncbi:MAG: GNAT family N-acetyltransferase, partial [Alphaproteobacteria bacterium]|nr:GNAT family N-acetyltransferase [Alphaproteobacteria bacterium]
GAWTDDFWMAKLLEPLPGRPLGAAVAEEERPAGRPAGPEVQLREMRTGDGAAFSAWDKAMSAAMPFALKLAGEVAPAEAIERDIAAKPTDPRLWLVAAAPGGDAIVGFAAGSIEYGFRMQHDAFVNVAVLPAYRRAGLARRLHDRIESWALDQGVRRLTASVQAPNAPGRAFAAALGYEVEVRMRSYSLIDGRMVDRLRLGKLFAGEAR